MGLDSQTHDFVDIFDVFDVFLTCFLTFFDHFPHSSLRSCTRAPKSRHFGNLVRIQANTVTRTPKLSKKRSFFDIFVFFDNSPGVPQGTANLNGKN